MNDDDTPSARYIVAVFAVAVLIVLLAVGAMTHTESPVAPISTGRLHHGSARGRVCFYQWPRGHFSSATQVFPAGVATPPTVR